MKRFIVFLSILFYAFYGNAQEMENGDFLINSGNNSDILCGASTGGLRITFLPGSVPNWSTSHGSPNLGETYSPFVNDMWMVDVDGISEGIVGGYPFNEGRLYIIHFGVRSGPVRFRVILGNGPRPSSNSCLTWCNGLGKGGIPPVPSSISSTDPNMQEIVTTAGSGGVDHIVGIVPHHNFDWIMIFPSHSGCTEQWLELMYVHISPQCLDNLFLPHDIPGFSPSAPMPARGYFGYKNIYAGSIHGPSPSTPVSTAPTGITHYQATEQIIIDNTFIANPTADYVLMDIKLTSCESFACNITSTVSCISAGQTIELMAGTPGGTWSCADPHIALTTTAPFSANMTANILFSATSLVRVTYTAGTCTTFIDVANCDVERPLGSQTGMQYANESEISIFPNPTQNNITISYPCNIAGELQIRINDVSGRTRYTQGVTCNQGSNVQQVVDMSEYAPGVYFVDLTLNDQHVVKKIVKL